MNTLEIKKMSIFDRLQVMEAVWDSFMEENIELDSPEWHENILKNRKRGQKPPMLDYNLYSTIIVPVPAAGPPAIVHVIGPVTAIGCNTVVS